MSSNFIDYVKIFGRSGKGGAGSRHFRREKFVNKGGPDGGDGGRGGHVILRGNTQIWTLLHLKYQKHILAEDGNKGEGARRSGAYGKDAIIDVPLGTIIKNPENDEILGEITEDNKEIILFRGGKGGLGNYHFRTSTKQAPEYAQPGESNEEGWVILELKLLADVGLVGFPNAGKSTLLSVISAAKPEIASYPFTTLVPQLGVVSYGDYQSFVVADIPGIIEGAAEGKGLGLRFLRHIERNSILLFLIPADEENHWECYQTLVNELQKYNPELVVKKRVVVISKIDLLTTEKEKKAIQSKFPKEVKLLFISAILEKGLGELKEKLWETLKEQ